MIVLDKDSPVCSIGRPEITAAPRLEPVAIEDARDHVGLDGKDTSRDRSIIGKLASARQGLEHERGLAFVEQTVSCRFPVYSDGGARNRYALPRYPAIAIVSATRINYDGTTEALTLADFVLVPGNEESAVDDTGRNAGPEVQIVYTAGYRRTALTASAAGTDSLTLTVTTNGFRAPDVGMVITDGTFFTRIASVTSETIVELEREQTWSSSATIYVTDVPAQLREEILVRLYDQFHGHASVIVGTSVSPIKTPATAGRY